MPSASEPPNAERGARVSFVHLFAWVAALCAVIAGVAGCDHIALTAPSGSSVSLFTNLTVIPLGGTAQITATVIEAGGTPVHDGTEVTFVTTIGTITPTVGQTDDGKFTATLQPGNQSGTAFVRAFSGGAQSDGLELIVGAAAVAQVVLTANPSSVSSSRGGSVTLSALVVDEGNNPVPNVQVSFTSTAGTLIATRVVTDTNGEARTVLNTNRETRVRALVGANESNEVTIVANNAPRITVTPSQGSVAEGTAVTFTFNITTDNNTAMRSVSIDFGDGEERNVGTQISGSIPHSYIGPGTYVVTVTGTDINGEVGTGSTAVVVTAAPPLVVGVTVSPNPTRVNTLTTVTATLTNSSLNPLISRVSYDFGDGSTPQQGGLTSTYVYTRVQEVTVRVTVTLNDGRSASGTQRVIVNP